MAKAQTIKFIDVVAINDNCGEAPIIYRFDTKKTRAAFVELVDIGKKSHYVMIDRMSERDYELVRKNTDAIRAKDLGTMELATEAGDGDPYYGLEQNPDTSSFFYNDVVNKELLDVKVSDDWK